MTQLLQRALGQVSSLADADQDAIAAMILDELEDEERWRKSFAGSQDALARLADDALLEYRAGRTKILDPEKL